MGLDSPPVEMIVHSFPIDITWIFNHQYEGSDTFSQPIIYEFENKQK